MLRSSTHGLISELKCATWGGILSALNDGIVVAFYFVTYVLLSFLSCPRLERVGFVNFVILNASHW
jgi:hypothetical protein